jgi:hypothetical protein
MCHAMREGDVHHSQGGIVWQDSTGVHLTAMSRGRTGTQRNAARKCKGYLRFSGMLHSVDR